VSLGGCRSRRGIPALGNCELVILTTVPLPPKYPIELKDIGDHLLRRRYDLKLSQSQVANIIGVSTDTVTYWENKRSIPQVQFYERINRFLEYNPFEFEIRTLGDKIRHYRHLNGLSQKTLGKLIGIDPSTIADWEENRSQPQRKRLQKILSLLGSIG
jgi:transcriptional regulator with XRE-family HTH domain